jgi:hypothetical protein
VPDAPEEPIFDEEPDILPEVPQAVRAKAQARGIVHFSIRILLNVNESCNFGHAKIAC